jgi:hypothetical protein
MLGLGEVRLQVSFSRHKIFETIFSLLYAIVRVNLQISVKDFLWFCHFIPEIGAFENKLKIGFFNFSKF